MYILRINVEECSEYSLEVDLFHSQNLVLMLKRYPDKEEIVRIANKHCNFAYYGLGADIELEIYSANIDSDGVIIKKELIEKFEVN